MADSRAEAILKRQAELESGRANFDTIWQQVAERVLPGEANFQSRRSPGEQRTERMMDVTASLAARKFAAMIESLLTPRTQRWHKLTTTADDLAEDDEVKRYFDELNRLLFQRRYSPQANFTGQVGSTYLNLGVFGTAPMFVDDVPGYGLRYRANPLSETYISENHVGLVDTVHRKFLFTARQAVAKWGDKLPAKIVQVAGTNPEQPFEFIHCVKPVGEYDGADYLKARRFLYASVYVACEAKAVITEGGYRTMPYAIARDLTTPGEVYGRSPAMWALPTIKMLNEMKRSILRAAHKVVEPPMLLQEDGALASFDFRPGAVNHGGIGVNGELLAQPLDTGGNVGLGQELLQIEQQLINESFFITLFQILQENPKMTATEVLERAQEKGMLLGPLMGRQQSEFLGPIIEREIDILAERGELPPMPDVLLEAGGEYKIEYESPLARAQRAEEGVAILRTLEGISPLVEIRPDILDNYDLDELARQLAEINGMPLKILQERENVEAIREQRAEAAEAAAMVEAAPKVAGAAKDLSAVA